MYMFPMVEGATVSRFSMYDGDKEVEGRILDKDEARELYESIVRQRKDPAILEYVGRNTFRARIYPIPANGDKRIKLMYSEALAKESGMIKYVYPLSTERFSAKPLQAVRVTINLKSKVPICNIYSPSHQVEVKQTSPTEAVVEWKGQNLKPDRDLILYYALSDEDFPIQVLTHHEPGEPGYFMLLASPKADPDMKPLSKDVVFVLDRTGSMSGKKIEQAEAALKYCLQALRPNDRFNVIAFNEDASWFKNSMVQASKANVDAAVKMVDGIDARGGTNIDKAMKVALAQFSATAQNATRRPYVVFLTDGLPTVGETDVDIIQKHVNSERGVVRIFAFGVGYDVNAQFLDKMAQDSKADADYVRPEEDIEVKVTSFFDKVSDPVLADVKLTISGVKTEDFYPSAPLPDMFKGSQLIVIGKYDGAGQGTCTLSGVMQGKVRTITQSVQFSQAESENEFIPRLWAARKIGYLLDEIRLHRNQELIDEVVRLSREFGIATEFTSFLADERNAGVPLTEGQLGRARESASKANSYADGQWAVNQSGNARDLRNQAHVPGPAGPSGPAGTVSANTYIDASGNVVATTNIQNVGTRTFYRNPQNQWIDAKYDKKQKVYNIRQYSEAHFQLLAAKPELRKYSTLGEVTVEVNGNAVQIGATGQEKLSPEEMKAILGRP
jgi:Ca-activated chloride channel family protein